MKDNNGAHCHGIQWTQTRDVTTASACLATPWLMLLVSLRSNTLDTELTDLTGCAAVVHQLVRFCAGWQEHMSGRRKVIYDPDRQSTVVR